MNNKNIRLFNYVYSNMFEEDKEEDLKWQEFKEICINNAKCDPYDFIKANRELVTINEKNMWVDLMGNKEVIGEFVILNFMGQKEFLNYKANEIKAVISNYGREAFNNLENIFDYMCNEAIREVLIDCRNKGLIEFDNNIFKYASNRLYIIIYCNIRVVINKQENDIYGNKFYINNSGQLINQLGNVNNANISKVNDEQLFALLNDKLEAIKIEMKNSNCENKLLELENALKNRDKKSILSILAELASIGSFIAAPFLSNFGG